MSKYVKGCVCLKAEYEHLVCGQPQNRIPAYLCTRMAGHEGPHVACDTEKHILAVWGCGWDVERTDC